MRVVIICKSDSTGGAAVASFRLMEALRGEGVDARMLVAERLSDSPYVSLIASPARIKLAFIADRIRIALANGFNRKTLFQLDAAAAGINLSDHPLVKQADAIIINWINQGVLSMKGIERLNMMGKRVIWTMHDMWNFTGLCHHPGSCRKYLFSEAQTDNEICGNCPLLGRHAAPHDLSYSVAQKKKNIYAVSEIEFVAVGSWLGQCARRSALLRDQKLHIIPNAFPIPKDAPIDKPDIHHELRLIFGAARLDDSVKDFPLLIDALRQLRQLDPQLADHTSITLFGGIKDPTLIDRIPIKVTHTGPLTDRRVISDLYRQSHIVISTSHYETLGGTLIEGRTYGCFPIATNSGGPADIITNPTEGIIIDRNADRIVTATAIAQAIIDSAKLLKSDPSIPARLRDSLIAKFSAPAIAHRYLSLLTLTPPEH